MSVPFIHSSFAAGELAPSMFGRVDVNRYAIGTSTMRNSFVSYRGGSYSRAGTLFVGFSKQTGRTIPPRLITFQFSINQGLSLEFGNRYMRVVSDGAFVLESAKNITGFSIASPAVVTVPLHGFSTGDWVYVTGVVGMPLVNGQTYVITVISINAFFLSDVYGNPISTVGLGAYGGGGTAARIFTLATPYADADLEYLKFTQSADVMSLTCWNQQTGTSYPAYDLSRLADNNWTLTQPTFGAVIAPPSTVSGVASVAGTTDFQYVITNVDLATGQESVASPIADVPNSVNISSTAGSITINWNDVAGRAYSHIYKAPLAFNGSVPVGSLFGFAGTAYGTNFVDSNITADFTQVPPIHTNPFAIGQITSLTIVNPSAGLTAVTFTINSATGSGATGYPVVQGGSLTGFVWTNHGQNYLPGDTITFLAGGLASGTVTFGANPTAGDTVTLNGVVWTFVNTISAANQILIGATTAATLQTFVTALTASTNAALTVASYTASATVLTVTFKAVGAAGNAYMIAASAATPSAGNLAGGAGAGGTAPTATLNIGPQSGTYPSVVTYFQERRAYAATPNNPDTYFLSQPAAFTNFDSRVPTIDSDAIIGSPWSVQVNGIQFMVPMPGGLVVFTGLQAWQLTGAGGSSLNPQPITPAGQQAQPQAYNGISQTVPPIRQDYDIYYVQAKGSIWRDISYNFFANIYTGTDITYLSSHLFTGYTVREAAWCEEPYKIIWSVRNDGILLSLTTMKSQEVMGWARHDTQGEFWSVCSVTEPPVDALYLATQRYPGGKTAYMIERMDHRVWPTIDDCWCVDAGLSYPMPQPNASIVASTPNGLGACSGTNNLVGGQNYSAATTAVVADPTGTGAIVQLTINNGAITAVAFLPEGTGYTRPQLQISDPSGLGSGASAIIVLDNSAIFTASAAIFGAGNVGSVIRIGCGTVGATGGGQATITQLVSPTSVIANITIPIPTIIPNLSLPAMVPAAAGSWSMTKPVSIVSGLNHLIGALVTGVADGQVIPPTLVNAQGSINLAQAASAIVVGLGFTAQVQTLRIDAGQPTLQGRRKKLANITARVEASRGIKVGVNQPDGSVQSPPQNAPAWSNLSDLVLPPGVGIPPYGSTVIPLYTGDARVPVIGGFAIPGQVAFQQSDPLPMNILAAIPELLPGDLPENELKPRETPQAQMRGRAA